jgi:hypothetical protein
LHNTGLGSEKIALNDESVEIREAIRISNIIKDIFAIKKENQ